MKKRLCVFLALLMVVTSLSGCSFKDFSTLMNLLSKIQSIEYGTVSEVLSSGSKEEGEAFVKILNSEIDARLLIKLNNRISYYFASPISQYMNTDHLLTGTKTVLKQMINQSNGNGQEGLKVKLYRWIDHGFEEFTEVTTGSDGRYIVEDIPYGFYAIHIISKEDNAFWYLFNVDRDNKPQVLYESAQVSGTVINAITKKPMKDVELHLYRNESEEIPAREDFEKVYSDENGYFVFPKVEVGYYTIKTKYEGFEELETKEFLVNGVNQKVELGELELNPDYYQYIADKLIPIYGLTDVEEKTAYIGSYSERGGWDNRYGVVAADIADYNDDKIKDCVVYYVVDYTDPAYNIKNPTLTAMFLTLDENGEIMEGGSEPLESVGFNDTRYLSVDRVKSENGYALFSMGSHRFSGKMPVFTSGREDVRKLSYYNKNIQSFEWQYTIGNVSARTEKPFFTRNEVENSYVEYATEAEAFQAAGNALTVRNVVAETGVGTDPEHRYDVYFTELHPVVSFQCLPSGGGNFTTTVEDHTDFLKIIVPYLDGTKGQKTDEVGGQEESSGENNFGEVPEGEGDDEESSSESSSGLSSQDHFLAPNVGHSDDELVQFGEDQINKMKMNLAMAGHTTLDSEKLGQIHFVRNDGTYINYVLFKNSVDVDGMKGEYIWWTRRGSISGMMTAEASGLRWKLPESSYTYFDGVGSLEEFYSTMALKEIKNDYRIDACDVPGLLTTGNTYSEEILETVIISGNWLNIRSGAGTGYDLLASDSQYVKGDLVDIFEYSPDGRWGRVLWNGRTGWISMDYTNGKNL